MHSSSVGTVIVLCRYSFGGALRAARAPAISGALAASCSRAEG